MKMDSSILCCIVPESCLSFSPLAFSLNDAPHALFICIQLVNLFLNSFEREQRRNGFVKVGKLSLLPLFFKMEIANFPMNVFELCMISSKVALKLDDNNRATYTFIQMKRNPSLPNVKN